MGIAYRPRLATIRPMESGNPTKPVIGLLGGVGAGKSTVAAELAALGCAVISGDALGHEVLREDEVKRFIACRWGADMLTPAGEVDRGAMAQRVFQQPEELAALTDVMYPRIRRRIEQAIALARADASVPAVVLDAAVMLEAGWDDLCTDLVFVQAPPQARAKRVHETRGWDERSWLSREKSQISLDRKRSRCQYILDNSSSVPHLRQQIRELFDRILHANR